MSIDNPLEAAGKLLVENTSLANRGSHLHQHSVAVGAGGRGPGAKFWCSGLVYIAKAGEERSSLAVRLVDLMDGPWGQKTQQSWDDVDVGS